MSCRVGLGFDAHSFAEGRRLVLGGVQIPHPLGLAGHSDADVLVHAVMDALLGACGERDIGVRFPDSDPTFRDISSLVLLEEVMGVVSERGCRVLNVDCVLVAQEPRLSPYIEDMRKRLAFVLRVPENRVGIKATTTEGMGFTGRGEGIAAMAVALVEEVNSL
ncbi:MAG: 2-C-methyl-D-erythritol 2,4-cyclodiphosphate synthase [Actinobacteria bacterium]|nr:2-C-methyl-D-erythritol 2,4-cyclodiphosphate synthase [Actinomycetota bacterium]